MSRTIKDTVNDRGRVRKTIDLDPPIAKRAIRMVSKDKKRRTLTRFIEDLLEAEYERLYGKAA